MDTQNKGFELGIYEWKRREGDGWEVTELYEITKRTKCFITIRQVDTNVWNNQDFRKCKIKWCSYPFGDDSEYITFGCWHQRLYATRLKKVDK